MLRRMSGSFLVYAVLSVFAVAAGFPILWVFYTAFKTNAEISSNVWALPENINLDNFHRVISSESFAGYYANSAVVSLLAVAITLVAASMAGYAFARVRFRGKGPIFHLFLAGMMIPIHIVLIPLLKIFGATGLYDTRTALVLVYVAFALPVSIFILRGFFAALPEELAEAAALDGCSPAGIFWRVMLPLARPAIAAVGIFNLVTMWNEFVFALTFVTSPEKKTLPVGLMEFSHSHGTDIALTCAALVMAVVPPLLIYFAAQKHIVKGITAGIR